jgi:ferric enterobactin receptor
LYRFFNQFLFFLIFLFLFAFSSQAQPPETNASGKITGRIIDSVSAQPIEYATISLLKKEENKVINGTTTDSKGVFKLTDVAEGTYKMLIYFIGYQTGVKNTIVISKSNSNIALGNIKLANKQTTLKKVTVTSEKNTIENKIDKMVYNADKDITSQSGVATDILKKIPQVSIDADGNVELQGNSGIRFLINGKPSTVFGNNIADVLQSIPASQVQSIEVITSPGARYDAEGTAGIINIILKKSTAEGINGNVSLSGGSRLENASVNLNAHHRHFSANAFFSGNAQLSSGTINIMNRISEDTSFMQTSQLIQNGTSDFSRNGYQTGIGFDWDITHGNNISGSLGYDYFGNNNAGIINRQSILTDESGNTLSDFYDVINTTNKFHEQSFDYDLSYKKKFKKEDQELEFSINSSIGKNYSYYQQAQKSVSPDSIIDASYGSDPGVENETNIEVNYIQPFGEDVILETGGKTILNRIKSTSDVYLRNPASDSYDYNTTQSSLLDYKSNVYAGYLSGTFKSFKVLDVKTGFRYEYTETKAWFSNAGDINIKPYSTYVPSLVISHKFKNNQTLKISYTHRIERPEYRDLNPFINASDPKNITTGNTNLHPEIGDKIELGYSKNFEKGTTINSALFYRGNKDDIQSFTRYYPSYEIGDSTYYNVAVSTRENVGCEDNYGLSFFISIPVSSKINLRSNTSCFERYIITGALPGNNIHGFNYRINLNAAYLVTNTMSVELFGNFNSPRINAQGKMPSFTTYNFAFRQQLFRKKGSIAITSTNPFNKSVTQKTELIGENFTSTSIREIPYRSFGINFTYKFGRLEFKKEKEMEDINLTNPPSGN